MTTLALLVIAIIWVAVLLPPMLRYRAENRSSSTIGDFRQRLGVLRRTGSRVAPHIVEPRTQRGLPVQIYEGDPIGPHPTSSAAVHGNSGLAPVETELRPGPSGAARQRTMQRRRDVLVIMSSVLGGSLILGAIPSLRLAWVVSGLAVFALAAYVVLLVQLRRRADERGAKLAYLPRPQVVQRPTVTIIGKAASSAAR